MADKTHIEKMCALGEISGQVAHEMNNLVSLMLAFTQSARRSGSKINIQRALDIVIDVSAKILHLSGSILNYLKEVPSRYAFNSPVKALENILELMQPILSKENISIEKDLFVRTKVSCDINQLQQVFINLINNARDAFKKTKKPVIRVSSSQDEKYLYIEIKDNGCGMSDAVKKSVFNPFFTTKKGSNKNLGIGLSVCRDIVVKRHLGKLRLSSSKKNGTSFKIALHKGLDLQPKVLQPVKKAKTNSK
ncbi:sensor histidine kinase [Candidatus Omnitrophota bacterium]